MIYDIYHTMSNWDLVNSFFEKNKLTNHQINSYNNFIEIYIQQIINDTGNINLNADNEEKTEAIGSMCVLLQDTNGKHGRGQILTASSPVDILCYTDGEVLKQGEKALVLSWSEERRKYLVTKY